MKRIPLDITTTLQDFINELSSGKATIPQQYIDEYQAKVIGDVQSSLLREHSSTFSLRMSNIGRPLRQLMLDKLRGIQDRGVDFKFKAMFGHQAEALMLMMLKASGLPIEAISKKVSLDILGTKVLGEFDFKLGGKIYDVKSASDYAYNFKFTSLNTLCESDSFGYVGQLVGYALADNCNLGGWIIINKSTGEWKVLEISPAEQEMLFETYTKEFQDKVTWLNTRTDMPPCTGVVEDYFNKKPTGHKVLNTDCSYCDHKEFCHPGLKSLPDLCSKAKEPKIKHYVEINE